jgi:hypothetical protein
MFDKIVNSLLNNIPILSSVVLTTIGWIVSYKVGISGLKYQFKKEEYYKTKETFININNLFLNFFEYAY